MSSSWFLTDELRDYLAAHSTARDPLLDELSAETAALGRAAGMLLAPEQGTFLTLLTAAIGVRRAVEIGTFTGYSSLCIARGLVSYGTLLCCDVSEEWTSVARRYWERAGVADRIELRLGPAAATLAALSPEPIFDLALLDADKPGYLEYYELLLPRLRQGGLLLADNVLQAGGVLDPSDTDAGSVAIRAFNDRLVADPRVEVTILPLGDGLTVARKL